jgi:hypothetical protein
MQNTFRIRGVIGMAAIWAVGLSAFATSTVLGGRALGVIPPGSFSTSQIVDVAGRALLAGGLAGALFAVGLARTGRSTPFSALTDRKAALWGLVGGVSVPAVLVALAVGTLPATIWIAGTVGFGALGAALGVGTLRIARRTPRHTLEAPLTTQVGTLPPDADGD